MTIHVAILTAGVFSSVSVGSLQENRAGFRMRAVLLDRQPFAFQNTQEVALTKGEGRSIWLLGDLYTFKFSGEAYPLQN